MVVDDLNTSPSYKLARIMNILESNHGVKLNFEAVSSLSELEAIYETYSLERSRIIRESAYNSYTANPSYNEAILIQEAIHIFLSEVAPKRIKRTTKTSS